MTREQYIKITQPYRDDPTKRKLLEWGNKLLTIWIFFTYPCILLALFLQKDPQLFRAVLIPLIGFFLVSAFRYAVNRKRPYETFEIPPVFSKNTKGKSFPSRHVFSAMIIALTVSGLTGFAPLGISMIASAALLGYVRVVAGIHYPSDVTAGMISAIVITGIGLYFLQ